MEDDWIEKLCKPSAGRLIREKITGTAKYSRQNYINHYAQKDRVRVDSEGPKVILKDTLRE